MVMCAAVGAQAAMAAAEQQELSAQAGHSRIDDLDRWKELVVTAAFVDVENETVACGGSTSARGRQRSSVKPIA